MTKTWMYRPSALHLCWGYGSLFLYGLLASFVMHALHQLGWNQFFAPLAVAPIVFILIATVSFPQYFRGSESVDILLPDRYLYVGWGIGSVVLWFAYQLSWMPIAHMLGS